MTPISDSTRAFRSCGQGTRRQPRSESSSKQATKHCCSTHLLAHLFEHSSVCKQPQTKRGRKVSKRTDWHSSNEETKTYTRVFACKAKSRGTRSAWHVSTKGADEDAPVSRERVRVHEVEDVGLRGVEHSGAGSLLLDHQVSVAAFLGRGSARNVNLNAADEAAATIGNQPWRRSINASSAQTRTLVSAG
jgi:hypothetical protein